MTTENTALSLGGGQALYDFDLNDFGVQPDYPKEFLNGTVLIIHGVSEGSFDGEFSSPARSLLHSWPSDFYATDGRQNMEPYGALMSEDSPVIRQAQEMQRKGTVPFVARLRMVPSKSHKNQTYWTMERARLSFNQDGELVDPNVEVEPEKPKGK